jgi:hypothetical protein
MIDISKFEPAAATVPSKDTLAMAQVSIAISLKRIADAMTKDTREGAQRHLDRCAAVDADKPKGRPWALGEEVMVPHYNIGRVTEIGHDRDCGGVCGPAFIGVTPDAVGYQMNFDPKNVNRHPE